MSETGGATDAGAPGEAWNPALRPNATEDILPQETTSTNIEEPSEVALDDGANDSLQESAESLHNTSTVDQEAGPLRPEHPPNVEQAQSEIADLIQNQPTAQLQTSEEDGKQFDVDPAWGFSPVAPSLQHTSSFPPVPPLHQEETHIDTSAVPQSQAEAVMAEVATEAEAERNNPWGESHDTFFSEQSQDQNPTEMGAGDIAEPSDAEARFEEGVPLVPKEDPIAVAEAVEPESHQDSHGSFDAFGDDGTQDDFFDNVGKLKETVSVPAPGFLDRKSTAQVISSIGAEDSAGQSPDPVTIEASTVLSQSTGGGIAVSTTTVASQVLSETLEEIEAVGASKPSGMKEDDIDALWQAAIGDEDLLEDDASMDPSSFFEDDGEGFLDDNTLLAESSPPVPTPVLGSDGKLKGFDTLSRPNTGQAYQQYTPTGSGASGPYTPSALQSQPLQASQYAQYSAQPITSHPQYGRPAAFPTPTPAAPTSGPQSFADKAKGGYTSPFDAPMDLSRPKRRPMQPIETGSFQQPGKSMPPPPPRSSSMAPPSSAGAAAPPQGSSQPGSASYSSSAQGSEPRPQSKSSNSSFFEELPIAAKARPPSASIRTPPSTQNPFSPQSAPAQPTSQPPAAPPKDFGLVAPSRQMSFGEGPSQAHQAPSASPYAPPTQPSKTAPPANNRYSPAPASIPQESPSKNRYAVPPQGVVPPRAPSISNVNQYQPRTSSPLLHSSSISHIQQSQVSPAHDAPAPPLHPQPNPASMAGQSYAPPPPRSAAVARVIDPAQIERPQVTQRGLVQEPEPPFTSHGPKPALPQMLQRSNIVHDENTFLAPNDGSEHDPMRRWQGAPIFRFGFGGSVVTSFPKRVPRFTPNQAAPVIKCAPGEINVQTANVLPLDEVITSFPGPLKGKGKKKDVLNWLSNAISRLESESSQTGTMHSGGHTTRREENLLLWKILRVLVEHDGAIDGNPTAIATVRQVLTPEVQDSQSNGVGTMYYQSPTIVTRGDPSAPFTAQPGSVEEIRKLLLRGEREKAVWFAVDQKLWGHAMLIASTLPPELWKQVTQDFVKNEVRTAGDHTESLAALYDVFSGNWQESMDQLVPSSARAGLHMVSKVAADSPAKNAFEGLDRWRETLSMILSNRSAEDSRSLASLGQLLLTYGRTEAAHICYIFSRMPGLMSGADDPQASIVLLGENHRQQPLDYCQDLYSVLLTEVYEFAVCVLAPSPIPAFAYLQSFKLWHATMLAESGTSDQAQQYCDSIASSFKSSTKTSPYYHPRLFAAVEDLSNRIRSSPRDGSGSWISKPSMDKVSGSMWSKFSQFVSGDESDAASASSKVEAEGPFAKISGDTPPSISRGPSPSEQAGMYSSLNGFIPSPAKPIPGNSRYAPKGQVTSEPNSVNRQPSISSFGSASPDFHRSHMAPMQGLPSQALSYSPSEPPYAATGAPVGGVKRPSIPFAPPQPASRSASDAGIPSPPTAPTGSPYEPLAPGRTASPYEPRQSNYAPRSGGYEPRSYQPSPKPAEPAHSEHSYAPMAENPSSMPPPISVESGDIAPGLDTPTNGEVPPTPKASEYMSYGYEPQYPSQPPFQPVAAENLQQSTEYGSAGAPQPGYMPPAAGYEPPASGYEPPPQESSSYEPPASSYEPPSSTYEPHVSSYEPPSSSYEPPSSSYAPPEDVPNGSPTRDGPPAPKKKGIMDLSDDEDDLAGRAAALKKQQRAENDRKAAEAFRLAAEADAARDGSGNKALNSKGSGWLGGWFGRGKSEDGAVTPGADGSKKPIKARLGEESSFYYDAELKKWVNRKGGAEAAAPAAPTPPPPRGPPSRSASAAPPMGRPPTSNPSGASPPMGGPPMAGPPLSRTASPAVADDAAPGVVPGVAPPSRPGTGMSGLSTASSIDDLIGAPAPRRAGGTARKAKKKGYVDVMAK